MPRVTLLRKTIRILISFGGEKKRSHRRYAKAEKQRRNRISMSFSPTPSGIFAIFGLIEGQSVGGDGRGVSVTNGLSVPSDAFRPTFATTNRQCHRTLSPAPLAQAHLNDPNPRNLSKLVREISSSSSSSF